MFEFLRRLFQNRQKEVSILLFDEDEPETSSSYQFKPDRLWRLLIAVVGGAVILTLLLIIFTPVGELLDDRGDARLREQVIEVSQRVQALQDSLRLRDVQLTEMQRIITAGDTAFEVDEQRLTRDTQDSRHTELTLSSQVEAIPEVSDDEIIFSETFKKVPDFPAEYPVRGTFTRGFDSGNGHYGIDIATGEGTAFRSIADGVVIDQSWTANYGYVIHVQHNGGFVAIYKHAASLLKSTGDIVLKGDLLGTAGDRGILSTGSHLHVEIWKNGVPQNPNKYLIKS